MYQPQYLLVLRFFKKAFDGVLVSDFTVVLSTYMLLVLQKPRWAHYVAFDFSVKRHAAHPRWASFADFFYLKFALCLCQKRTYTNFPQMEMENIRLNAPKCVGGSALAMPPSSKPSLPSTIDGYIHYYHLHRLLSIIVWHYPGDRIIQRLRRVWICYRVCAAFA